MRPTPSLTRFMGPACLILGLLAPLQCRGAEPDKPAAKVDCAALAAAAEREEARIDPVSSFRVGGQGRLYFHTAPDTRCRSQTVFVIPGDSLVAYTALGEWMSVYYVNSRTGQDFQGWVVSDRLVYEGTLAPRQH